MGTSTAYNTGGAFGYTASGNSQVVEWYVNADAGALVPGDIVIYDTTGVTATSVGNSGVGVKKTAVARDKLFAGVVAGDTRNTVGVLPSYAVGASVPVVTRGVARANVGANTPAAQDVLGTVVTTGVLATIATPLTGEGAGICMHATKDANNCLVAWIGKL